MDLCLENGCRRKAGHSGAHNKYPTEVWSSFFNEKDRKKIVKAGFATPRGGAKGAYQNHVDRSNKVIIPFEFIEQVDLTQYQDGYVVRLFPDQYFDAPQIPRAEFLDDEAAVRVGDNAFVLYRTHSSLNEFPPMAEWELRHLIKNGEEVDRRSRDVEDHGHFVLRLPTHGQNPARNEGPPQGLFATEYADLTTNFLCKCVLAMIIVKTEGAPYSLDDADHLVAVLEAEGLGDWADWRQRGILGEGGVQCPLCLNSLQYEEYHETLTLADEGGLANAGIQVAGATRSTQINLFHLKPLIYRSLVHIPENVAWGHAVCNTRLGQRPCYSVEELAAEGQELTLVGDDGTPRQGRMSMDGIMIRSESGGVWIEIVREGGDLHEPAAEADDPADE